MSNVLYLGNEEQWVKLSSKFLDHFLLLLLLHPREWLRSIVMSTSVCVSVCLSVHDDISGTTHTIFATFLVHVAYGCTSGFLDDIVFIFYSGPYSSMNFTTKDWFCSNLFIYYTIGQNSISYYYRA